MNRTAFLAAVHELAEQLGRELYSLIEGQAQAVRVAALEVATSKMRAALGGEPTPIPAEETQPQRARATITCRVCGELGHNARSPRHRAEAKPAESKTVSASTSPPHNEPTGSPASKPPPGRGERKERDVSPRKPIAHRVLHAADPANNVPPPGWTVDGDRREEHDSLGILTVMRKAR